MSLEPKRSRQKCSNYSKMSNLKIINTIIRIENFMCVYRNYCVINGRKKCLLKIYILATISAHLLSSINILSKTIIQFLKFNITYTIFTISYNIFSNINNIAALILSSYHSQNFQIFIQNVNDINIICGNEAMYQKSIKKLNKPFIKAIILCIGIILLLFVIYSMNIFAHNHNVNVLIHGMSHLLLQCRYLWESLAFHVLIEVMVANMEYLNSSIRAATSQLDKECESLETTAEEVRRISNESKKWGGVSALLVNAVECLGFTFRLQVSLSLWSSVLYHIVMLYQAINYSLHEEMAHFSPVGTSGLIMILTAYFLTKLSVLWSGQRACNQAQRLDAALARLHATLLHIPGSEAKECARATARLVRRLRAAPLRLRLLSSLTVQMALLAEILGVVANYTIVLLQFNHVV